jgi:hypothetical protein
MNYQANDKQFADFFEAIRYANTVKCDIVEIATGKTRWTPAPPVSAKRIRDYNNRKAAYEAQQRMIAGR